MILKKFKIKKHSKENLTMDKAVRTEWEHYLFEDDKEYTFEEVIKKITDVVMFLKEKKIRVTANMFLDSQKADLDYHLSKEEKETYIHTFNEKGYALSDCETIVKVMDVIYHMFDITVEKAYEMAEYTAENHLTLTQMLKELLKVDLDEINEFLNTVLYRMLVFTASKTIEFREEFEEMLNGMLLSLN